MIRTVKCDFLYDRQISCERLPGMRSSLSKVEEFLNSWKGPTSRFHHIRYGIGGHTSDGHRKGETAPTFHPEFGRFMLEATPGKPWGIGFKDLLDVEHNMAWR